MNSIDYKYSSCVQRDIVHIIRDELARESAADFPLLKTFPNSETLGVPQYFANLSSDDRETLLDAMAYYSLVPFSHELINEQKTNQVFHKFTYKQPSYGSSFMVGRPPKNTLKKALIECLNKEGFDCKKEGSSVFARGTIGSASATVWMHFNPGAMRQFYFGVSDWMSDNIRQELAPLSVKWQNMLGAEQTRLAPIIEGFSYDQLWTGSPASPCDTGWDLISQTNLNDSIEAFNQALKRLGSMIEQINGLI